MRYRYRTAALVGPWRSSIEAALADAVTAGQATPDRQQPGTLRWLVPGEIEAEAPVAAAAAEFAANRGNP